MLNPTSLLADALGRNLAESYRRISGDREPHIASALDEAARLVIECIANQFVPSLEVGVDGAILVSPFSMYRYDASYALEVFAAHPSRFRLVKPVDPTLP